MSLIESIAEEDPLLPKLLSGELRVLVPGGLGRWER